MCGVPLLAPCVTGVGAASEGDVVGVPASRPTLVEKGAAIRLTRREDGELMRVPCSRRSEALVGAAVDIAATSLSAERPLEDIRPGVLTA